MRRQHAPSSMAGARRGLTLLELLLAIAVTAMISVAIATVMTAVARGVAGAGEARSSLQRAHAAHVRIRAYTDVALALLQHDPEHEAGDGFAMWLSDTRPGRKINLSEVRVIWFDADAGTMSLERVAFPAEWPAELVESNDIELAPETDFMQEMVVQRKLGYTETLVLADGLTSMSLAHNALTVQQANRFRLTLGAPTESDPGQAVLLALAMPNHEEPQ